MRTPSTKFLHQAILVAWPLVKEVTARSRVKTPPPTENKARKEDTLPAAPVSEKSSNSAHSSVLPTLRYATPEEVNKFFKSIEEEKYHASVKASYEKTPNSDRMFRRRRLASISLFRL
jgi:hypothetical protein